MKEGNRFMKKLFLIPILFLAAAVITACNKESAPEDRFSEYVDLWNEQKFAEMYDYLSLKAQEKITKEEFVSRYEKIYSDLEIDNLSIQFNKPEEVETKEGKTTFPFSAKMDSIAGEISFDHQSTMVKEERDDETNWYVNWDTTYIFPELEEGETIGLSTEPAKRGDILDKNGESLATTGTVYEIGIVPANMEGQESDIISKVADLLGMTTEQIEKQLNASWVQPEHFVPIKKISTDETELLEKLFSIPSVVKRDVEGRVYPLGEAASHLIGYVGPITAEELEKHEGYTSTDVIGKRGLEQVFEEKLKGENGVKIFINKKDGSEKIIAEKEVKHGEDLQLTIDASLQQKIYSQFNGEPGTAAAIHPKTGETLALVSSPGFNPTTLSLGATSEQWKALEDDANKPLLNRFKATFAPGSVIKPITASIGLAEGTLDWEKTMDVSGLKWQKDSSWGNYYVTRVTDPKSPVNLEKAIILSDNIFFAQTALDLGAEKFTNGLKKFGFEEEMPYSYPLEPSKIGQMDKDVTVADSGYGQGQIEMNILHLAATYTPFINNGNMIKPVLLTEEEKGEVWKEQLITDEQANKLNAALSKVVNDPSGTARSAKIDGKPLAGKTGTAELKAAQGEKGKENGWFVAYNTDDPNLLIAMMVEGVENKGGSSAAVEKVKNVFQDF